MSFSRTIAIVAFWIMITGLSLYFFFTRVLPYAWTDRISNFGSSLFNNQLWIALHLTGGTMALLAGPVQFWPAIRQRYLRFHRITGKVYIMGVVLLSIASLRLSLISTCVPCRVSLFLLTLLAMLSTWFAWKAIKARNIKTHRQMMVRSYICVFSFVLVRVERLVPLDFIFGKIEDPVFARTVQEYFFSFFPLIVAEIIMVWIPSVYRVRK